MVGHETVRSLVMGKDFRRKATPEEIARMAALVEQGMREGALGLSSGLEYDVGSYASTGEVVELCKAAARHGGFYMTHVRDEADRSFEAFAEAVEIARSRGFPCRFAHQAGHDGRLGPDTPGDRALRSRAQGGHGHHSRRYPYEVALHRGGARSEQAVRRSKSVEEALRVVGGPARLTITASQAHRATPDATSKRSPQRRNHHPVALYSEDRERRGRTSSDIP